jgi:hypothetical protein
MLSDAARFVFGAAMLTIAGFVAAQHFVIAGRMIWAAVYGLLIPIGTILEWRAARLRSEAEGRAAEKLLGAVAFALMGTAL